MRIVSIDFFRTLAVIGVIVIHTKPFMHDLFRAPAYRLPEYLCNQPTRVAVPFFFVVAGYFLAQKIGARQGRDRWRPVAAYLQRMLLLFTAWSLLYVLIPSQWRLWQKLGYQGLVVANCRPLFDSPLNLLLQGGKVHLWFLPSLMLGVVLLTLSTMGGRTLPAVILATLLFLLGLAGGSYSVTPVGLHLPFSTRNGPFLSMICLLTGYLIFHRRPAISPSQALTLVLIGFLLHGAESWLLWRYRELSWFRHDYLVGTVVAATGLFLFALATPDLGRGHNLQRLGQYTLGVYLCHYLFIDLWGPLLRHFERNLFQLLLPWAVFWCSVGLTALLSRFRWSKVLVS